MHLLTEGVGFKLQGVTKTSLQFTSAFFAKFDEDKSLCVYECLQVYIAHTKQFQSTSGHDVQSQLLISCHRPHLPVKVCSIAGWIKAVLTSAGINTTIFKSHSTRGVSTLRAWKGGISLEEVMHMAEVQTLLPLFTCSTFIKASRLNGVLRLLMEKQPTANKMLKTLEVETSNEIDLFDTE